jgi:hypothetical protein
MRAILNSLPVFFCALVWGAQAQKVEDKKWGRLFFSPAERMQRMQPSSVSQILTYQGVLHSKGKKPTYWLNASMQQRLSKGSILQNNRLMLREGKDRITLLPGDTYDVKERLVIPSVLAQAEE